MDRFRNSLQAFIQNRRDAGNRTIRMHIELYLSIFALVAVVGLLVILFLTNNIFPGRNNISTVIQRESQIICDAIEERLGNMTAVAINFSEMLSTDIEYRLWETGITFQQLQEQPDVMFDMLDRAIDQMMLALERADCSGAFVVLNASINPDLPDAENSRAGIYLRHVEPKRIGNASEMLYLRGFTSFAQRRNMTLQANWDLEFQVEQMGFWELALNSSMSAEGRKLSELYAWHVGKVIPQNKENSLLCSVPLLGSKGEFLGVCGFEVTDANFRSQHALDAPDYPELAMLFSSFDDENVDIVTTAAMFSGDKMIEHDLGSESSLYAAGEWNRLDRLQTDKSTYFGKFNEVAIYHNNAFYNEQRFALTVLLAEDSFVRIVRHDITRTVVICAVMLVLGIVVLLFLSKRIAKPFETALTAMASTQADDKNVAPMLSVGIRELDELLQIFSENNPGQPARIEALFESFLEKVDRLTPTERAIVTRYMRDESFETVMSEMFIANSTLKTHNIHIYKKLETSGVHEIKLYLRLISGSNSAERLFALLEPGE